MSEPNILIHYKDGRRERSLLHGAEHLRATKVPDGFVVSWDQSGEHLEFLVVDALFVAVGTPTVIPLALDELRKSCELPKSGKWGDFTDDGYLPEDAVSSVSVHTGTEVPENEPVAVPEPEPEPELVDHDVEHSVEHDVEPVPEPIKYLSFGKETICDCGQPLHFIGKSGLNLRHCLDCIRVKFSHLICKCGARTLGVKNAFPGTPVGTPVEMHDQCPNCFKDEAKTPKRLRRETPCRNFLKYGKCPYKDKCMFSHDPVAVKRKTRLCNNYEKSGMCPWGDACIFAHGIDEIRA